MGTLQKTVDNLQKLTDDKKNQITERYIEHSSWLNREFLQLRDLIQSDGRSDSTQQDNEVKWGKKPEKEELENSSRSKRKSPETCLDPPHASPETKRNSSDYEELADAAGLPTDLNKLKKEALLSELEKRGVKNMSMKSLKKDLIDMLKVLLANETKPTLVTEQGVRDDSIYSSKLKLSENQSDRVFNEPQIAHTINISTTGSRKGSLMAEFRNQVLSSNNAPTAIIQPQPTATSTTESRFDERMGRYRASQARKSEIMSAMAETNNTDSSEISGERGRENIPINSSSVTPFSNATTNTTQNKSESNPDSEGIEEYEESPQSSPIKDSASITNEPSEWMVVDSPKQEKESVSSTAEAQKEAAARVPVPVPATPVAQPQKSGFVAATIKSLFSPLTSKSTQAPSNSNCNQTSAAASPAPKEKIEGIRQGIVASSPYVANSTSNLSKDTAKAKAVNSSSTVITSASSTANQTTTASTTSATNNFKKPGNLVNNQPSFISGSATNAKVKPVVAALQQAEKKRIQDENREKERQATATTATSALAKKKEADVVLAANTKKDTILTKKGAAPPANATASTSKAAAMNPPSTTTNVKAAASKWAKTAAASNSVSTSDKTTAATSTAASRPVGAHSKTVAPVSSVTATEAPKPVEIEESPSEELEVIEEPDNDENDPVAQKPQMMAKVDVPSTPCSTSNTSRLPFSEISTYPTLTATPAQSSNTNSIHLTANAPGTTVLQKLKHRGSMAGMPVNIPTASPAPSMAVKAPTDNQDDNDEEEEYEIGEDEYQIEDRSDSDSDDSGTDDDGETEKAKQQKIPDWARGSALQEAIERQCGLNGHTAMDPDTIFPEVHSCSLEDIFGCQEGKYRKYNNRSSSAHWDADKITLVEKRKYRAQMGFA